MELLWQDIESVSEISSDTVFFQGEEFRRIDCFWKNGDTISVGQAFDFISSGPRYFAAFFNLLMIYRSVSYDKFVCDVLPEKLLVKFEKDQDQFVLNMQLSNMVQRGNITSVTFKKMYSKFIPVREKCEGCARNNYLQSLRMQYFGDDIEVFDLGVKDEKSYNHVFDCDCEKKEKEDKIIDHNEIVKEIEIRSDDHLIMTIINSILTIHKCKVGAEFDVSENIRAYRGDVVITKKKDKFDKSDLAVRVCDEKEEYCGIFYTYSGFGFCVKGLVMRSPFILRESGVSFVDKMTVEDKYLIDSDVVRIYFENFKKDGYVFDTTDKVGNDVVGFISNTFSPGCDRYIDLYNGKMVKYKEFPVMQYMIVSPGSFVNFSRFTKYVDGKGNYMRVLYVRESCFVLYRDNKIRICVKQNGKPIGSVNNEYRFIGVT